MILQHHTVCCRYQLSLHWCFKYVPSIASLMHERWCNFPIHRNISRSTISGDEICHISLNQYTVLNSNSYPHNGSFQQGKDFMALWHIKTLYHVMVFCASKHDCVTKWKHFRVTGTLWWESTSQRLILVPKASDTELWCFLWSAPEQAFDQIIVTPVIRDAIAFIMTSLQ